jgi:hypothetical protein
MAQRMESAAAAGGILCSESTARLAQPSVVFGPMEFVSVNGSHEPIPTRRLERVESDRLVLGRNDGPLVGRDVEMAHLLAVFDAQDMSVVSVVGDPGVGKSRLIRVPGADADTLDALVATELIDQIQFVPVPRYQFRHPLVRSVCYESQLRSTRAASHKRLAMWVQERNDEAVEQNAALIARHFEAAGELAPAYSWYAIRGLAVSPRCGCRPRQLGAGPSDRRPAGRRGASISWYRSASSAASLAASRGRPWLMIREYTRPVIPRASGSLSADWAVSVRSSSKQFSSSACPPTIQAEKLNCARCDAAIRDTRAAPRPSSCSASPERSAAT